MKDSLGDRMKSYEDCYRFKLMKRSYVIIRVDGKAFHTYTKGLQRPFDDGLIEDMNETAAYLCKNIMGAKFAYVQSDEISILVTDFEDINTQAWFDNNIQKMVSVAASMATSKFNQLRLVRVCHQEGLINPTFITKFRMAEFDARAFVLPNKTEVENYLIWRQQDATRNSISSVAQSMYSPKELHGKSSDEKQEMIFQKGINWNDFDSGKKRGRFIEKVTFVNGVDVRTIQNQEIGLNDVVRNRWIAVECPVFTQDRNYLNIRIKSNG
jgi:tRNA(His) 5'-end guanylyltransferase